MAGNPEGNRAGQRECNSGLEYVGVILAVWADLFIKKYRQHYELTVCGNITIIRRDSAAGKTALINLIGQEAALEEKSGMNVACE